MKEPPMKRCRLCGRIKPLTDFHRRALSPDGRQVECKVCRSRITMASRLTILLRYFSEHDISNELARRAAIQDMANA